MNGFMEENSTHCVPLYPRYNNGLEDTKDRKKKRNKEIKFFDIYYFCHSKQNSAAYNKTERDTFHNNRWQPGSCRDLSGATVDKG